MEWITQLKINYIYSIYKKWKRPIWDKTVRTVPLCLLCWFVNRSEQWSVKTVTDWEIALGGIKMSLFIGYFKFSVWFLGVAKNTSDYLICLIKLVYICYRLAEMFEMKLIFTNSVNRNVLNSFSLNKWIPFIMIWSNNIQDKLI